MEFKSMQKWRVQQDLNISDSKYKRIERTVIKRHFNEDWIDEHLANNGKLVTYLKLEFVEWIKDVYFNKEKFYLDAEIEFFKKQIKRLENELNVPHYEFEYDDLSLKDLRKYFYKSKNTIGVAINKMEKRTKKSFKYVKDGKVIINKNGVKWLSEKYFRKNYLKQLEFYKFQLQNLKRKKYGYKELEYIFFDN